MGSQLFLDARMCLVRGGPEPDLGGRPSTKRLWDSGRRCHSGLSLAVTPVGDQEPTPLARCWPVDLFDRGGTVRVHELGVPELTDEVDQG